MPVLRRHWTRTRTCGRTATSGPAQRSTPYFLRTPRGLRRRANDITAGQRLRRDELACKPDSVPRSCRGGDHPSRTTVAGGLVRSTRELGRAALERSLSDLAPGGVCRAARVTPGAGGLLHHRFTLARRRGARRSAFCGTVPRVAPGGRYPPPCPVESGLSSSTPVRAPTRPPGQLVHTHSTGLTSGQLCRPTQRRRAERRR